MKINFFDCKVISSSIPRKCLHRINYNCMFLLKIDVTGILDFGEKIHSSWRKRNVWWYDIYYIKVPGKYNIATGIIMMSALMTLYNLLGPFISRGGGRTRSWILQGMMEHIFWRCLFLAYLFFGVPFFGVHIFWRAIFWYVFYFFDRPYCGVHFLGAVIILMKWFYNNKVYLDTQII